MRDLRMSIMSQLTAQLVYAPQCRLGYQVPEVSRNTYLAYRRVSTARRLSARSDVADYSRRSQHDILARRLNTTCTAAGSAEVR